MADLSDIINESKFSKLEIPKPVLSPKDLKKQEEDEKDNLVKDQLTQLFKTPQRQIIPSPEELTKLITKYFEEIYPENYGKHTLHTYLGFTEKNITVHILPNDELKEIYEFAIEKMSAKYEIMMQINGRSTDGVAMQNIAKWRKKDPEETEEVSGLAELHKSIDEYKKKKDNK